MRFFLFILFAFQIQQIQASTCTCVTRESTKEFQKYSKDWYGTSAQFSCRYECSSSDGRIDVIEGFHKKTVIGEEIGNEIICDGTIYKEVRSKVDNWSYLKYEGNEPIDPKISQSPTLRAWAKKYCP